MKNYEYFMNLPYRIEIQPIAANRGGGYEASIPELGKYSVCADGETMEEALINLQKVKQERITAYLDEGLPIPEPHEEQEEFSGKFVLRIPKYLHRDLALKSKQNNISLNQFVVSLLSGALQAETDRLALQELQLEIRYLGHRICDLKCHRQGDDLMTRQAAYVIDEEPKAP
jgi:antitoxin HicB